MTRFLHEKEEPSKMCALSTCGFVARLVVSERPGFETRRCLKFFQASFLKLHKLQLTYADHCFT